MNKRNAGIVESYKRSTDVRLSDCYDSWSKKKEEAYDYCIRLKEEKNGKHFRIISSNGWMFTAGFTYIEDGKQYLMYITKNEDRPILLED